MKITIISSLLKNSESYEYQEKIISGLRDSIIELFDLDTMEINSCTGCWGCWVKTPGICVIKDDMSIILKSLINSDLTIFLSKPVLGYVDGTMKMAMDRTIPLVHPYIEIVDRESHHRKRYKKYPKIGLLLYNSGQITDEDKNTIELLFQRYALNFKSELIIFSDSSESIEEDINEIKSI